MLEEMRSIRDDLYRIEEFVEDLEAEKKEAEETAHNAESELADAEVSNSDLMAEIADLETKIEELEDERDEAIYDLAQELKPHKHSKVE